MTAARIKRLLAVIVACALATSALADDIYESLADVRIGRVFLSPEQRVRLDDRRGEPPPVSVGDAPANISSTKRDTEAAGFIMSSSGRSRVWLNGDFVATDEVPEVRFPGEVKIIRKPAGRQDADPVDAGDGE